MVLVTQAHSSATTLCPALSSQPHRAAGRRPRMVAVRGEADDKALEVAGTEEADAPAKSKGLGFGSSASKAPKGGKKKGSRERGSVIRRTPIGKQALLSPSRDSEAEKQSGNEGAFLLTWLGLGILIFVEGIVLASSGFLPEEWDKFFVKYLYPLFTPTVFLFVGGTVTYGVLKYIQSEKQTKS